MPYQPRPTAVCETCGRIFYGLAPLKFCDVPTCRGYLRHAC
jgi:hypothetical protein